ASDRNRRHGAGALGGQAQAVLKTEDPGHTRRDVLAKAVSKHAGRLDSPGAPELGQRILERKDHWQAVGPILKAAADPRPRIQHLEERLFEKWTEQLLAFFERGTECGLRLV